MPVKIESFGQLSEITGKTFEVDVNDTDQLIAVLSDRHQALTNMKYLVAVNKKIVYGNTVLNSTDAVALLPPYSGG